MSEGTAGSAVLSVVGDNGMVPPPKLPFGAIILSCDTIGRPEGKDKTQ